MEKEAAERKLKAHAEACAGLLDACMAAQLHLMVRPHMRMPEAEANVVSILLGAIADARKVFNE